MERSEESAMLERTVIALLALACLTGSSTAAPVRPPVTAACQQFIDTVLKSRFLPAIRPTDFNYPVDISGKWLGHWYRFIQRYRSGFSENRGEEFDSSLTRLDWVGRDRFDIQWHRHTGEWFGLYRGQSLTEALRTIETDGPLHPL